MQNYGLPWPVTGIVLLFIFHLNNYRFLNVNPFTGICQLFSVPIRFRLLISKYRSWEAVYKNKLSLEECFWHMYLCSKKTKTLLSWQSRINAWLHILLASLFSWKWLVPLVELSHEKSFTSLSTLRSLTRRRGCRCSQFQCQLKPKCRLKPCEILQAAFLK
jgi:hypothetical protein